MDLDRLLLPPSIADAVDRLDAAGLSVWLVGGAVRNSILGSPVDDFDLVVEADLDDAAAALPHMTRIDAAVPVLAPRRSGDGVRLQVAAPRGDATSVEQDLRLRDFTLNAIAFDPVRGRWLDPLGGRDDLAARCLRATDPARALRDDPIRILRAVRLEVELCVSAEPETERALQRDAPLLCTAPGERLRDELFRLLETEPPSAALERLRHLGALAAVLPELLRGVGVAQNRHHTQDVYTHTLAVCDLVHGDALLRLAALLHDASKPESKRLQERSGDFSFHRHDLLARPHVERAASRLRLSNRQRDRIDRLVRHHLLYVANLGTPSARRRMVRRVGSDILDDLLELRRADLASREPSKRAPAAWEAIVSGIRDAERHEAERASAPLALSGREVMDALDIEGGPEVGRWLRRARRRVAEHPEENERGRLLTWLREARREEAS